MKATLVLLAALFCASAYAFMDEIPEWNSVQIETLVDSEPVVVRARVTDGRLVKASIQVRSNEILVPQEELKGLPPVRLSTVRVVSPDVKRKPGPTLRLEFQFAPLQPAAQRLTEATVEFHFAELAYQGRVVERPTSVGSRLRELKLPGRPPQVLE